MITLNSYKLKEKDQHSRKLSKRQQWLLQLLKHNTAGLNTPELQARGVLNPAKQIGRLKKKGCKIKTVLVSVTDTTGLVHKRVANYIYEGWEKLDAA